MRNPVLVIAAAATLFAAGDASAHARLIKSQPRLGEAVTAPRELRLTFSERIVADTSSVKVEGPGGAVATGKLKVEPKVRHLVVVPLQGPLKAGDYKVRWTMTTEDTHTMQGSYAFKVK